MGFSKNDIMKLHNSSPSLFQHLTKKNENGVNSLMLATECYPEALPRLLGLINALKLEKQSDYLAETTRDGWNAFATATRHSPLLPNKKRGKSQWMT
jgi:hypothetical protein